MQLPSGIPNHLYAFPEQYGATKKGIPLSESDLIEVAELSHLGSPMHYLSQEDHDQLHELLPEPEKIECKDLVPAFKFLRGSAAPV